MTAERDLVLQVFYLAVLDALNGDDEALAWLDDYASCFLEAVGLNALAQMTVEEWLNGDLSRLAEAMGIQGACRYCDYLRCRHGQCWCSRDQWVRQGRRPVYARATVMHDTRDFLRVCVYYSEKGSQ